MVSSSPAILMPQLVGLPSIQLIIYIRSRTPFYVTPSVNKYPRIWDLICPLSYRQMEWENYACDEVNGKELKEKRLQTNSSY
jgi:hypothetical protein